MAIGCAIHASNGYFDFQLMIQHTCRRNVVQPNISHRSTSKSCLIFHSRSYGIKNTRNIPRRIEYTARRSVAVNGSSRRTYTKKMGRNMESVGDARRKCVDCVMRNGMDRKIARRMKKPIDYSKRQNKRDGKDAIVAGLWWN